MAPAPGDGGGWERWCGQHEARIDGLDADVKALFHWRDKHETDSQRRHVSMMERLTSVETKLVIFAALAAAGGAMLPSVVAALVKSL